MFARTDCSSSICFAIYVSSQVKKVCYCCYKSFFVIKCMILFLFHIQLLFSYDASLYDVRNGLCIQNMFFENEYNKRGVYDLQKIEKK